MTRTLIIMPLLLKGTCITKSCVQSKQVGMHANPVLWFLQILYFKGIESGHLPHIPWADVLIYAFSTAFVFHAVSFFTSYDRTIST